jgi:hypothetical protein
MPVDISQDDELGSGVLGALSCGPSYLPRLFDEIRSFVGSPFKKSISRFSPCVPGLSFLPPTTQLPSIQKKRDISILQVIMQLKNLLPLALGVVASAQSLSAALASQNASLSTLNSTLFLPSLTGIALLT